MEKELLTSVSEKCPAFSQGCPYSNIAHSEETIKVASKCPYFESKCPFAALKVEDLQEALSKIPKSHIEQHGILILYLFFLPR